MEPILNPEKNRFTVYPIEYPTVWKCYQTQQAAMWKAQEVDFSNDYTDFQTFSPDEQHFIKNILAFFSASDGLVNWNLSERFTKDVQIIEAKIAYSFQMTMEWVHAETYSLMLDNIVRDTAEKVRLINALETVDSVGLMGDWAKRWVESDRTFAHRLVAFACVEGIFFSGAFAAIFWIRSYKGNKMTGLLRSNEFIARDEGMHVQFACVLYDLLQVKLSRKEVLDIVTESVEIAKHFMKDSLRSRLIGINDTSMCQYIEYVADTLLVNLGYDKHYKVTNPFTFMETIGMLSKTNFFESRENAYQSAHVFNANKDFVISDDF